MNKYMLLGLMMCEDVPKSAFMMRTGNHEIQAESDGDAIELARNMMLEEIEKDRHWWEDPLCAFSASFRLFSHSGRAMTTLVWQPPYPDMSAQFALADSPSETLIIES